MKSCTTDQFNHAPAQLFLNSGFSQPGRPCLGSWTLYGLGAETNNLPSFVVMSTGGGLSGGTALWSSGFLPTTYTGVRFREGKNPILNVSTPPSHSDELQKDTFDLVNKLNAKRLSVINDEEIATRMVSYEMAARLQSCAPELMDLKSESDETINLRLRRDSTPLPAPAFARRMVQRGVRFINITAQVGTLLQRRLTKTTAKDRAGRRPRKDLDHGLLDETLIIWGASPAALPW